MNSRSLPPVEHFNLKNFQKTSTHLCVTSSFKRFSINLIVQPNSQIGCFICLPEKIFSEKSTLLTGNRQSCSVLGLTGKPGEQRWTDSINSNRLSIEQILQAKLTNKWTRSMNLSRPTRFGSLTVWSSDSEVQRLKLRLILAISRWNPPKRQQFAERRVINLIKRAVRFENNSAKEHGFNERNLAWTFGIALELKVGGSTF